MSGNDYGSNHRWQRRRYARMIRNNGGIPCARCKQWIAIGEPWHLGHPDSETPGGPEHVQCNLRAPARLRREQKARRMELTRDQEQAARLIFTHDYDSGPLTICGYAGTGKSWLAGHVIPVVFPGKRLVYTAPTNKAARIILRGKLEQAGLQTSDFPRGGQHEYADCEGDRYYPRFTEPLSLGTVFSLLHFPKTENVCETSREPCREGGQCKTHRQLPAPAGPCLLIEGPLLADPRADPLSGAEVIVVDEASMLSRDDYLKLCEECARRRIPLILFGDPGQLPPVRENYSSALTSPAIILEEPHRQAENSPIIALSWLARTGQPLVPGSYPGPDDSIAHVLPPDMGGNILAANGYFAQRAAAGDMIICPRNDGYRPGGRVWHNNEARKALGFTGPWPVPGDVVVSVSTDYYLWRAFNGSRGVVLEAGEPFEHARELVIEMTVKFSEHRDPRRFLALARQFGWPATGSPGGRKAEPTVPLRDALRRELRATEVTRPRDMSPKERKMLKDGREPLLRLDYGYALTAWKAQGDEARGVLVVGAYDRLHISREQYLYTAITRSRSELAIG